MADSTESLHVVIMAGGVGTRLWPISRRSRPKQFQPLLSNRTMLVDTYERGFEAAELANKMALGQITPTMALKKLPFWPVTQKQVMADHQ